MVIAVSALAEARDRWEGCVVLECPLSPLSAKPVEELNELARVALSIVRAGGKVVVVGSEGDDRCLFIASALSQALNCPPPLGPLSPVQELALAWHSRLTTVLGVEDVHLLYELGRQYDFGAGLEHASTVANIGLDILQSVADRATLVERDLKTVYAAGLLHDVGRFFSEYRHEEVGVRIMSEHSKALGEAFDTPLLLFCIRHHRRHTEPRRDLLAREVGERGVVAAAAIRLADAFTNAYGKEEYWGARREGDKLVFPARFVNEQRFRSKARLLERVTGLEVELRASD